MKLIKTLFIQVLLCSLLACFNGSPQEVILFDFETDAEIYKFQWKCYTLFSLENDHVSHGVKSLKLQLFPSTYPGLSTKSFMRDWSNYNKLSIDIYNAHHTSAGIGVRIDDEEDYPNFNNRYSKKFVVNPGLNQLHIPLHSLKTNGTQRPLNVKNIKRLFIFMSHPQEKYVMYIDYIRLIK